MRIWGTTQALVPEKAKILARTTRCFNGLILFERMEKNVAESAGHAPETQATIKY